MIIQTHSNLKLSDAASNKPRDAELCDKKPAVIVRPSAVHKRDLRDMRRKKTAIEAIADFEKGVEIFGFTKGQFSCMDMISAIFQKIGYADRMSISTWACAKSDVHQVLDLVKSGKLEKGRWLFDYTFQRRMPGVANEIRQAFGKDGIRVAKNHAKFITIRSENWKIVMRSTMNLNFNPRFEHFTLAHDPEIYDFIENILDSVWNRQGPNLQFQNAGTIEKHFENEL